MASIAFLEKAYLAYFGRPVDATGAIAFQNSTEAEVEAAFYASPESQALYGTTFSANQVNAIYNMLFGRDAEPAGLLYWVNQVALGLLTPAGAALGILNGALNDDATAVANKLIASAAFTAALDTTPEILGYNGDAAAAAARAFLATVTTTPATPAEVEAAVAATTSVGGVEGETFMLTTGVDQGAAFVGTAGNDTFTADYDVVVDAHTLGSLDILNGGAGVDTLKITSENGSEAYSMAAASISAIEKIEIRGSAGVTADVSGSNITGLESISVLKATSAQVTAADTTDITISGVAGEGAAYGGKNVTITNEAGGIEVGKEDAYAVGAINVTATKQVGYIEIDGGSTVTVNATSTAPSGNIKVGFEKAATGAVVVTQNLNDDGSGLDNHSNNIYVEGGSTVNVTINATSTAIAAAKNNDIEIGDVQVVGDGNTTAVTVTQNASVTTFTTPVVAEVKATQAVTFLSMTAGQTAIVGGLTFTASKALTANEAAAAFAALTKSDTQDKGGPTANGIYEDTFSSVWSSTSVSGATVTFTGAAFNTPSLAVGGTKAPTLGALVAGTTASGGVETTNAVDYGSVNISDDAEAAITTITLDGYDDATLGGSSSGLDALTTLSLANGSGTTALYTEVTTLNVTLDNMEGEITDENGKIATMNLTTTGGATEATLNATGMEALNITAGADLDIADASSVPADLANVTITGAGAVNLGTFAPIVKLDTFNASGNTGGITTTIETDAETLTGAIEEYVFSQGADNVTLESSAVDVKVTLGAGNDTLTLALGTVALNAVLDGGEGVDTLVMTGTDAEAVSAATVFETNITGFEKLKISSVNAGQTDTVNLANMDDISYVISGGSTASQDVMEVQEFTVTNGVTATKTNMTQTIAFAGSSVLVDGAGTILVGGVSVELASNDNDFTIAAKVALALNGAVVGVYAVAAAAVGTSVTVTFDTRASSAQLLMVETPIILGAETSNLPVEATLGTSYNPNDILISVNNVDVTLTAQDKDATGDVVAESGDDTAAKVAAKIATALEDDDAYIASATDATVTVQFAAAGDQDLISIAADGGVAVGTVTEETAGAIAAVTGNLTLTQMANNGTLELTASGTGATTTVTMTDAEGTADSFNIVTKVSSAHLDFGTVVVADVETINITATDTIPVVSGVASIQTATLDLTADAAKTVNVTGNANLDLSLVGSGVVTLVDASTGFTGKLEFTASLAGLVVKGGSAADTLFANASNVDLYGNGGGDTLTVEAAADRVDLFGGAGADTFVINGASTTVSTYAIIRGVDSGDVIKMKDVSGFALEFQEAEVTLSEGATISLQALADQAMQDLGAGEMGWFQDGVNTFIVLDAGIDSTETFVNGTDMIVMLTGLVNLGTGASFNATNGTLEIA